MAFSFVVETGTGSATATSYISVADADDYFEIDRVFAATWAALTTTEKEYLLGHATRVLDQAVIWKGTKYTEAQALDWPRTGVYTAEGYSIDVDEIPQRLKDATCEFAKFMQTNDPTVGTGVDYIRRITLDVLEIEYQDGTSQSSFPSLLNKILEGLGAYPIPGQSQFAKISKV